MKKEIIDIDAEFDGVEFDEAAIARYTGQKKSPKKMKEAKNSIKWRESIDKYWGTRRNNPEKYKESTQKAGENRRTNIKWLTSQRKAKKRLLKPIVTPFGIFESIKSVTEYAFEKKICSRDTLYRRLKSHPNEYYYITQEEYIMLTGKDI